MVKKRDFKRVVVMSDMHCGHKVGLTPPDWWYEWETSSERQKKVNQTQRELWGFFKDEIDLLKPIDRLIVNGDLVDGKGGRSGATELRTADRAEQAEIAAACINYVEAEKVLVTFGTPYHSGMDEDWELEVVERLNCRDVKISGQDFPLINGVQFDVKHFVSSSSIPHGQATPLLRSKLWNDIWASEHALQPKAQILIRSHVHYYLRCDKADWTALTTPMMMGFGDKYGVRKMDRIAEIGFIHIDIESKDEWNLRLHRVILPSMKALSHEW